MRGGASNREGEEGGEGIDDKGQNGRAGVEEGERKEWCGERGIEFRWEAWGRRKLMEAKLPKWVRELEGACVKE